MAIGRSERGQQDAVFVDGARQSVRGRATGGSQTVVVCHHPGYLAK